MALKGQKKKGSERGASPEQPILRARARGEVSADEAFEDIYALYAPAVRAWLLMRAGPVDADDLLQDVWTVFYDRFRRWEFRPEMEAPEARPVLSFLYRTCHFVLHGHRRRHAARAEQPLETETGSLDPPAPGDLVQDVELGRCLELARDICTDEERDVLFAKLAGVPAREIAHTLGLTEPQVDHRFRDAVKRLKARLGGTPARRNKAAGRKQRG